MNRRDLMKLFGVGAIVAPIVRGMPVGEAMIVEPPKVELPPKPQIIDPLTVPLDDGPYDVTLFMRSKVNGRVLRMECDAFLTEQHFPMPHQKFKDPYMTFRVGGPVRMVRQ